MKIAFLVESFSPPWDEGYKNIAKYISEMVQDKVDATVFSDGNVKKRSLSDFDLIYIFNQKIGLLKFLRLVNFKRPVLKHIAKKEVDISFRSTAKAKFHSRFLWDAVVTTTNCLKDDLKKIIDDKLIFSLPPPIPVDFFTKLDKTKCRTMFGLNQKDVCLAYTGRLNSFRHLNLVFEALNSVNVPNVKLLLSVYADDAQSRRLLSFEMDRLNNTFTDQVKIVSTQDVRYIYSCADLLVYPVERRGAVEPPLTVLEAMSCGTAVAAYRNPATQEIIRDSDNGFLFSNSQELGKLVGLVAEGSLELEKVGENARRTVQTNHSPEKLVENYLSIFKTIINDFT